MNTITANVTVNFGISFKARLALALVCLLGQRIYLDLPDATVTLLDEPTK